MNTAKVLGSYTGLALLAVCMLLVGIAAANLAGGVLAIPAGAAAAAGTFHALRRVTGRAIGAAIDSL